MVFLDLDSSVDLGHTLLALYDGVQYIIRKSDTLTDKMAKEIAEERKLMLNNTPAPTLIVMNNNFIDDSARKYLESDEFKKENCASAIGIITTSRAHIIMLKVVTYYMNLSCPIKFFTETREASKWLKQYQVQNELAGIPNIKEKAREVEMMNYQIA